MATITKYMGYLLICCMIAMGAYGWSTMEKAKEEVSAEELALGHGQDKVTAAAENIKRKMSDVASDGETNVVPNAFGSTYESAKEKFGEVKEELRKAYETAKQTMTEDAKTTYEALKERVFHATDELGEKMNKKEEL